jgi:hypothetical protein
MATCSNFQHNSFIYADYLQVQILQALVYPFARNTKNHSRTYGSEWFFYA